MCRSSLNDFNKPVLLRQASTSHPAVMQTLSRPVYPTQPLVRLADAQRKQLMTSLDQDGFVVLPGLLPDSLREGALATIDRLAVRERAANPAKRSVKIHNIVDVDPFFRALMMYEPALQL